MKKKLLHYIQKYSLFCELLLVFIITVPSFLSLLNSGYFSMHDDQHIVRLFLFHEGIKQGNILPRWVDILGFGYGFPVFNFYPPLMYYVAEIFHVMGFSLIWSIKLLVITGFVVGAIGMYMFLRQVADKLTGFLGATLFTYFFYHAVTGYVRGALAEFFSISLIPYLFWALDTVARKKNIQSSIWLGIAFALLVLCHPLISFPSVFYIVFFLIFYLIIQKNNKDRIDLLKYAALGGFIGLGLSMFSWLPSMVEKQYTIVDEILTQELASYKIHFIYPFQFLYSMWAYGGSVAGPNDGMTFQLGKVHMGLSALAVGLFVLLFRKLHKHKATVSYFIFFVLVLAWSIFMTITASQPIWDAVRFLWYLQFPWRFLTFVCFFISAVGAYTVYLVKDLRIPNIQWFRIGFVVVSILATIVIYGKYFKPQHILMTTDKERTTYDEIAWRISRTSFEFFPKGIKTKKSQYGTTIPAIEPDTISRTQYELIQGTAQIKQTTDLFEKQYFSINAQTPITFRLNAYLFPGWKAYIKKDGKKEELKVDTNNDFKLMTISLPKGTYEVLFDFEETPLRMIANTISIITMGGVLFFWLNNHFSLKRMKSYV